MTAVLSPSWGSCCWIRSFPFWRPKFDYDWKFIKVQDSHPLVKEERDGESLRTALCLTAIGSTTPLLSSWPFLIALCTTLSAELSLWIFVSFARHLLEFLPFVFDPEGFLAVDGDFWETTIERLLALLPTLSEPDCLSIPLAERVLAWLRILGIFPFFPWFVPACWLDLRDDVLLLREEPVLLLAGFLCNTLGISAEALGCLSPWFDSQDWTSALLR